MIGEVEHDLNQWIVPPVALVVEPSLAAREALARGLRRAGYEVQTAIAAEQAIELLGDPAAARYSMLVADFDVGPAGSGMELLRQVAALPQHRRPGRIVVLARAVEEVELGALGVKAEVLQKPARVQKVLGEG